MSLVQAKRRLAVQVVVRNHQAHPQGQQGGAGGATASATTAAVDLGQHQAVAGLGGLL